MFVAQEDHGNWPPLSMNVFFHYTRNSRETADHGKQEMLQYVRQVRMGVSLWHKSGKSPMRKGCIYVR